MNVERLRLSLRCQLLTKYMMEPMDDITLQDMKNDLDKLVLSNQIQGFSLEFDIEHRDIRLSINPIKPSNFVYMTPFNFDELQRAMNPKIDESQKLEEMSDALAVTLGY